MCAARTTRSSERAVATVGQGASPAPRWWQAAFATFALLIYYGVHLGLNHDDVAGAPPGGDILTTASQALLLLGGAALGVRYRAECLRCMPALLPFLVLLAMAFASSLWSQSPSASFRRSLSLATLMVFAVYAFAGLGLTRTCRLMLWAMWISAGLSLAVAAAVPASGFDSGPGYASAIRGVFTQKNSLGEAMTCGMLALSYAVLARRRLVWTDAAHAGLSLAMTVLAQSTTSLLLSVMIAGATLATLIVSRGAGLAGLCLLGCCLAAVGLMAVLVASPDTILNLLGKDTTLTGRSAIWAAIDHAVGAPTPLGFGYSAFWLPDSIAVQTIRAELTWDAPSAHSGYLDTLLELGEVGLGLVVVLAGLTLLLAGWAFVRGRWQEATWAVVLLLVTAMFNYDESSLPRPDIHLLMWILAFMALARALSLAARSPTRLRPPAEWQHGWAQASHVTAARSRAARFRGDRR